MYAKVKFAVREKDKGWNDLHKAMKAVKDARVKVGVLDDNTVREGGITNAELAAVHEFGAPSKGIPERSFIRSTLTANQRRYSSMLKKLVRGIYERKLSVHQVLNIMGAQMASDIKKRVTTGSPIPPPNAPSTVARKTRGRLSSRGGQLVNASTGRAVPASAVRTLIDTGRMIASVTWAVLGRGGKR